MWKKIAVAFFTSVFTMQCHASLIVPMMWVSAKGNGQKIGTIKLDDTVFGLMITPQLHNVPAGMHGLAVHDEPFCSNYARAAGGHLDPEHTEQHRGPFRGSGHLGDLPVLTANAHSKVTLPVLAPRLKLSQVVGHSLVMIAGGDAYTDTPDGSQVRLACGVVPYH
jgi:Cu-Zn family superoxide dismutase